MKKIVFGLALASLVTSAVLASTNDEGKGKKKKSCCSTQSGCGSQQTTK
jgi:hypothetical protein